MRLTVLLSYHSIIIIIIIIVDHDLLTIKLGVVLVAQTVVLLNFAKKETKAIKPLTLQTKNAANHSFTERNVSGTTRG